MVHRPALFIALTFVIAVIAAVHIAALEWYLYWNYPWLDVPVHFFSGFWIALASAWLITYRGRSARLSEIIIITTIVGIGWEVFEFLTGLPREANFAFDTTLDLIMDLSGALFGYVLVRESAPRGTIEN